MLFPLLSFVTIAFIVAAFAAIAYSTGSFDRLDAAMNAEPGVRSESQVTIGDVTLYVLGFVAVTFTVIFFNAALVAAAIERLRGGDRTWAAACGR